MPAEGLDWLPGDDLLTDDELVRVIDVAVRQLGIEEIRFTGGEPLLRKGIVELIGRVGQLSPRPEMSLTTNGIGFARRAADFAAAGLDRINISLDSLDPATFQHADPPAAADTTCSTRSPPRWTSGWPRSRSTPC